MIKGWSSPIAITYIVTLSFFLSCSLILLPGSCAIINAAPTMFFKLMLFKVVIFGGGGASGAGALLVRDILSSDCRPELNVLPWLWSQHVSNPFPFSSKKNKLFINVLINDNGILIPCISMTKLGIYDQNIM